VAPDAPELDAWGAIVAVYQSVLHDLVNVLEREVGMDSGVFSALAYLERATPPHRMRMSELQRLLHPRYSQPGFSRLVSRMEADGLVAREPDPDDGRAVQIVTTRVGRSRYQRASDIYTPEVRRLVGRFLSPDQCRALVVLLASDEVPPTSADRLVASARARVDRLAPEAAAAARDGAPSAPLARDLRP
jgi:DNA-binding MarR family transcriptional regulator